MGDTMTTDTIHDEPVTGEIVLHPGPSAGMEEYRPRIVMMPEEAKALDDALRANMRAVLHEGGDYGTIPGAGDKPTLKKPGAEKLLQWFGFGHAMERVEVERDKDGNRVGVTYRCVVTKGLPDGRVVTVAMCEGYAGYDEDRFYTSAEAAEQKERFNAEKYRRQVNRAKCVEYRAPWNTVIKMAQKRAMVGAALQATSASSLFTQDIEDMTPDAPATADPLPVIADIAGGIIRSLPDETRQAFNHWFREQGLPARPGEWTAEQWCAALVGAGRLDAPAARAVREGEAAAERLHAAPALDPGDSWLAAIESMSSADDMVTIVADLNDALSAGSLDEAKYKAVLSGAEAKAATFGQKAA